MSVMTYQEASLVGLAEEMERDPTIWVAGEDIGKGGLTGQYLGLPHRFGYHRFVDTGISETAIMGAGVGAAVAGTRPLLDLRLADFALCAVDELVNQAAKMRYMLGGQTKMPLVARMLMGVETGFAAQHSNAIESWWAHTPGLVVVMPSSPADNKGLLKSALRSDDPVVYMEHRSLRLTKGEVPDDPDWCVPIGKCNVAREGSDLTVVAWSSIVPTALASAEKLAEEGISAEIIDLRTIWPWDEEGVCRSVEKTGNLLIVHEAPLAAGFGAEIYATVHARLGGRIRNIRRHGAPRIPIPYSPALEDTWMIKADKITAWARDLLGK